MAGEDYDCFSTLVPELICICSCCDNPVFLVMWYEAQSNSDGLLTATASIRVVKNCHASLLFCHWTNPRTYTSTVKIATSNPINNRLMELMSIESTLDRHEPCQLASGCGFIRDALTISTLLNKPTKITSTRTNRQGTRGLLVEHTIAIGTIARLSLAEEEGDEPASRKLISRPNGQASMERVGTKQKMGLTLNCAWSHQGLVQTFGTPPGSIYVGPHRMCGSRSDNSHVANIDSETFGVPPTREAEESLQVGASNLVNKVTIELQVFQSTVPGQYHVLTVGESAAPEAYLDHKLVFPRTFESLTT
ncbi:hypothetical protein CC86DRAFT_418270 [Ophiobolus disseminans]|uniref:RNA 3'-terminal phosphate cyclase domain-containing protein n=1 Tax=Ophiobolus disseminans TaxID=1469910 RepID=A0A6A6ZXH8_9PLEO|nr:hypothetical protein CC86DRAFT_418270 [Ophiobolus disseminans]